MWVGVDVMQAHPCAEAAQIAGKIGDMGTVVTLGCVFDINTVGRGVLADDKEFAHARLDQIFRLTQYGMGGAALQAAAHVGDDAEFALVIAALGNFQIAVMARGEGDGRGRKQIYEGIGLGGDGFVDGIKNRFVLMRAGDGQYFGMRAGDVFGFGPKAAGDDDAAVFGEGLANRLKAFGLG